MDWLINLLAGAAVLGILAWAGRFARRRLARFTVKDGNAPGGHRIDWRGFFGRRR